MVKIRRAAHDFDVLLGDLAHEDIRKVDLGLSHQMQQQVQRPVELLQMNADRHQPRPAMASIRLSTASSTAPVTEERMPVSAPVRHNAISTTCVIWNIF